MGRTRQIILSATLLLPLVAGCKANGVTDTVASAGETVVEGAADAGKAVAGVATGGVPSLVNVNLTDVLNDLAVELNLDRANIPINAQIPITIAANVCGVSINILSVSTGGKANCTATTSSPELAQVVQQQVAAGGSVGGGAQGGSTAGTSGTTATGGTSASGSTGTTTQSTGSTTQAQPSTAPDAHTAPQSTTGTTTTTGTVPQPQTSQPQ